MQVLYVYAFLQIIFEALPVSSSGNVLLWIPLLNNLLPLDFSETQLPDFDFLLHIPTLFIVAIFFFKEWFFYVTRLEQYTKKIISFLSRCACADAFTTALYFIWKAIGITFFPLWAGFLCTTCLLCSLRFYKGNEKLKVFTYKDAMLLGIVQGCALLPGVSRLATTFVTAVWLGYTYDQSFKYSFMLQVPLIVAAIGKAGFHMYQQPLQPVLGDGTFYVLVCVASVVAFCLLSMLSGMVKRKSVWKFAWYTGVLSLIAACC